MTAAKTGKGKGKEKIPPTTPFFSPPPTTPATQRRVLAPHERRENAAIATALLPGPSSITTATTAEAPPLPPLNTQRRVIPPHEKRNAYAITPAPATAAVPTSTAPPPPLAPANPAVQMPQGTKPPSRPPHIGSSVVEPDMKAEVLSDTCPLQVFNSTKWSDDSEDCLNPDCTFEHICKPFWRGIKARGRSDCPHGGDDVRHNGKVHVRPNCKRQFPSGVSQASANRICVNTAERPCSFGHDCEEVRSGVRGRVEQIRRSKPSHDSRTVDAAHVCADHARRSKNAPRRYSSVGPASSAPLCTCPLLEVK